MQYIAYALLLGKMILDGVADQPNALPKTEVLVYMRQADSITKADLSDKTESATSFAVHVFLSFVFINCEFGGPI
jgi:hypothetical protein